MPYEEEDTYVSYDLLTTAVATYHARCPLCLMLPSHFFVVTGRARVRASAAWEAQPTARATEVFACSLVREGSAFQ